MFAWRRVMEVPLLQMDALAQLSWLRYGFTSRHGGVSEGPYRSLNLGLGTQDVPEHVHENRGRLGAAMGMAPSDWAMGNQVHEARVGVVRRLHSESGGEVGRFPRTDALVTDRHGILLVVLMADCVPIMIVDPVHRAVGVAHAGWRGTVARIGVETLRVMTATYGTRAEECIVAIGPSIGPCCFEVGSEVSHIFQQEFSADAGSIVRGASTAGGKSHVNLWQANKLPLVEAGVLSENVGVSGLCTCCSPDQLFSHRASGGVTGRLGAAVGIAE